MKKPMPDDVDSLSAKSTLQSQVFFSSSEYAVIPRFAIDLLPPMMDKIEGIWKKNFSVFSNRLASMRSEVLMASGENPDLIRELLRSTRLLETLKDNLAEETEKLAKFADQYLDESSKTIHEMPFKEVKARITHFSNRIKQLQKYASQQFRNIYNSCQELIQLEFNLTSIAEAQNLFGMNVDLFKDNPGWWWYPVIACSTTLLTMGVWITFKRSNALEDKLERRFRFLFRSKNRENDHEMALRQGMDFTQNLKPKLTVRMDLG
ncbi:MAG: hypothetical protein LQ342_003710 [Letrouitia transgressa]|nr:MAG: hypothetical protein LQ342_003710 [Letrouitia transgressa]